MHKNLNILLKQDKKLFHTQDLALLWNIPNRNTLLTNIKRYVQKEILYPVHKGFYSVLPVEKIDPLLMGACALRTYSYLTGETVLVRYGIILQDIHYFTFASSVSRLFKINGLHYKIRKLKDEFLYNEAGIIDKGSVKTASLERAVADMLYFSPLYFFDGQSRINWKKVKEIRKIIGYI